MRALRRINVPGLLTMLALIGLWEALVRSGILDFQNLPPPSEIARSGASLVSSGDLFTPAVHTLRSTLVGWVLASAVGIALGLILGLSRRAWRYSMASIEVMRAVPPVALVPVALLVFGFSLRMERTLIVYVGAWTVLVNTIDGVRRVRPELVDVARMLGMSPWTRVRKIVVPAAMPSIVVGLRLALSLSLVLAVVAEMIGNPAGLGNALVRAQQALQPARMFAFVMAIGVLGVALNGGFRYLSGRMMPWLSDSPGRTGR